MNVKPKVYQKECPICGTVFEATRCNAKYCEKHRKNGTRKLAQIERKERHERAERQRNKLITYHCEYCGKEHTVAQYLLYKLAIHPQSKAGWDDKTHLYCCVEHMQKDRHDHQHCDYCEKLLKGCDFPYNQYRKYNFCSADCEQKYKQKLAEERNQVFTCQYCGKQFTRDTDTAYFCSQDCANAARKEGWESPATKERKAREEAEKVTVTFKCSECGKLYRKTFKNKIDAQFAVKSQYFFCSKECGSTFWERDKKERRKQKKADELKKAARKPDEPLCASCRVSYKDCERMQSNFRIIPKGAHYNDKGILVKCPKYKEY